MRRLGPVFGFGRRMGESPKKAPVTDGVVKGTEDLGGEISDAIDSDKLPGIPTISRAVRPPPISEGKSLISRVRESILFPFKLIFKIKTPRGTSSFVGKRVETVTTLHRGRPWGWKIPKDKPSDIHLPATIRTAARKQRFRQSSSELALQISLEDVREKVRRYKAPMTSIFVIDLSGSMLFSLEEAKEALLRLHRDAYQYRDKVGIVALKETSAEVVQHPITNLGVVANKLLGLGISGFTPLASGMLKALEVLKEAKRRDRATIPVMIIITDGNANVPLHRGIDGKNRDFSTLGIVLREFEDLAVKDTLEISKLLKKEGIHTVVVNTNQHLYGRETYGYTVTKLIAMTTNGSHHQVDRLAEGKELVDMMFAGISDDQKRVSHGASLSLRNLF
ncbi:MAG: VWA domain-containing protein [Candidatus Heimdallarchaeota archaeon]